MVSIEGIIGDAVKHLQKLGFSDYEASAHVALLCGYPAIRYQLSQDASIPESRMREVVRWLQNKGVFSGLHGQLHRFVPPSPQDLISQLHCWARQSLDDLRQNLPHVAERPVSHCIWCVDQPQFPGDYRAAVVLGTPLHKQARGGPWAHVNCSTARRSTLGHGHLCHP